MTTDTAPHAPIASIEQRLDAIQTVLQRHGMQPAEFIATFDELAHEHWVPANGAGLVARAWTDPSFKQLLLRDLVNASIGFEQLARDIDKPSKSLHRMLSATCNPTLSHVSAMLAAISAHLGVEIQTKVKLT